MGRELLCTVCCEGKKARGKALLETNEIIFRGDLRLKIPLASLKSVVARDGELHLCWADGSAVFALGEQAEKWAHKILHPKSTAEKLGIKPGLTVSLSGGFPDVFVREVRGGAKAFSDTKPLKDSDLIFYEAQTAGELARVAKVVPALAAAAALWIVYPKGRGE